MSARSRGENGDAGVTSPLARTEYAHAKINLVLRILAREASGYHSIETLFQQLELHDVVTVRCGVNTRALACEGPSMPVGGLGPVEQNLAWRAADLYTRAAAWDTGWDISIHKQIPVGGGLGGGSSDAAAVLRAMNAMSPTPLGAERLLELGGMLGADVPFFVSGASRAWAWGRGDRLMVLPALPVVGVLLFPFADGVHTGAAYAAFDALRMSKAEVVSARAYDADVFSSWEQIAKIAENDFERVVPAMHAGVSALLPTVKAATGAMREPPTTRIGMLSGSGATCFVLFTDGALSLPGTEPVLTSTR